MPGWCCLDVARIYEMNVWFSNGDAAVIDAKSIAHIFIYTLIRYAPESQVGKSSIPIDKHYVYYYYYKAVNGALELSYK